MKILKPYKQIKRKAFQRAFVPGMYFYCERLPHKSYSSRFFRNPYNFRDINHPTKLIFKILDKNCYDMLYIKQGRTYNNEEPKWAKATATDTADIGNGIYYTGQWDGKKRTFSNYVLWGDFCSNLLINFKIMTREEFICEYFLELLDT